jgi:hypothetical protein
MNIVGQPNFGWPNAQVLAEYFAQRRSAGYEPTSRLVANKPIRTPPLLQRQRREASFDRRACIQRHGPNVRLVRRKFLWLTRHRP